MYSIYIIALFHWFACYLCGFDIYCKSYLINHLFVTFARSVFLYYQFFGELEIFKENFRRNLGDL